MTKSKAEERSTPLGIDREKSTASSRTDQLISPERMTAVLIRLAHCGAGPFSEEQVEIINWLANRELHRRKQLDAIKVRRDLIHPMWPHEAAAFNALPARERYEITAQRRREFFAENPDEDESEYAPLAPVEFW